MYTLKSLYALTRGFPESHSCHTGGDTGLSILGMVTSQCADEECFSGSLDQPRGAQRRIINGCHSWGLGQGVPESLCKLCLAV